MEGELIYSYTRQDAIDDGIFVDVTEVANRNGFKIPVAITTNLFHSCINKEELDEEANIIRLNTFLLTVWSAISKHQDKDNDHLLCLTINHDDNLLKVWVAIEAKSLTDPSPGINILLPEDY